MNYEDESDFKYVESVSDVPVTGQGIDRNWDNEEIIEAVGEGEAKLEALVNEGREITNPENIHAIAAATWATYRLAVGMKSPDAATRGDSLDEGEQRMDFAQQIREDFYDWIDDINRARHDESSDETDAIDFDVADW